MAARPTVTVQGGEGGSVPLPDVFLTPIRPDVVKDVHVALAKNRRQPYAVSPKAGMQHSAESWGTGRAVARIPRVSGGGTHAAGQGAFGNMCRHGRMFAPTKTYRRWHRRMNRTQRRYAVASALAASSVPALVLARGHRIEMVPEVPLVLSAASLKKITKTKQAKALLQEVTAYDDVEKVVASHKIRAGKGKARNRRYVQRKGPLVVVEKYDDAARAFRNIPGVEVSRVETLNVLQLAPGSHLGRFIVWTQGAFEKLDSVFGSAAATSTVKLGYRPPRSQMSNADLARIINSSEIQRVVRPTKPRPRRAPRKKNPLKNLGVMVRLNPATVPNRRAAIKRDLFRKTIRDKIAKSRAARHDRFKKVKASRKSYYDSLLSNTHKHEPKPLKPKK